MVMPTNLSSTLQPDARLPIAESLLALAPLRLPNQRKERYQGDDLCIPLTNLAARDQTLVLEIYTTLSELLYAIADTSTDDARKWRDVTFWTQRHNLDAFIDSVRELGEASHAEASSEELGQGHARRARWSLEFAARSPATPRPPAPQRGSTQDALCVGARPSQDHAQRAHGVG